MCSTALTAKRIYCLQIKKIILLCLTWMGMRRTPPLARSLSHFLLSKCNVSPSLSVSLPPSVTYSEKCSAAVYSANSELQLFLTVGLRLHTHDCWNMAEVGYVAFFGFFFRWLIDFSFFFFPETNMERNKDNFLKSVLLSLSEIPPPFLQILAVIKSH